jgi:hypothetical protein
MKKLLLVTGVLSFIIFIDYIVVAVIGCFANACGASDAFYCGPFCYIALAVVTVSLLASLYLWLHRTAKLQD